MDEVVETLGKIEQNYKLFQQQQMTFVKALKLTRLEANDLVRPVSSINQVQIIQHNSLTLLRHSQKHKGHAPGASSGMKKCFCSSEDGQKLSSTICV